MQQLRRILPSLSALFAFEAAARLGSFSRAADELGLSQAAVSFAVRGLEDRLGVRLFLRSHRKIQLSEEGQRFYSDVAMGLNHISRSAESLLRQPESHHVTLSVSTAFASFWMLPRLPAFKQRYPQIDIRLQTSDKDEDLSAGGISLGIRHGQGEWQSYDCALLAEELIWPVCSPAFLEGRKPPLEAHEVAQLPHIHLEEPYRPRPSWQDWGEAFDLEIPASEEGLRLNDYALVLQAAQAGEGVALGWKHVTELLVREGRLLRLMKEPWRTGGGFYLVWPKREALSPDAERLRDWMLAQSTE